MKKTLLCALLFLASFAVFAQVRSGNADLDKRLSEYLVLNKALDFEKLIEYVHPSIYKIAPKAEILKSFQGIFNDPDMKVGIDSLAIVDFGQQFRHNNTEYTKVNYHMTLSLLFRDSSIYEMPDFESTLVKSLSDAFTGKNVRYHKASKTFIVEGVDVMYGIRDANAPWMFLGYQRNEQMVKALFPQAVIDYFKML